MRRWGPLLLLLGGCAPIGLTGSVGGDELSFAEAVYIEQSGTDPGSQQPFHDFDLWLMPVTDSCSAFSGLLSDLSALRSRMQTEALDPTTYCNEWEATFTDAFGSDPFWMASIRLKALPRPDGVDIATRYTFWDDAQSAMADAPNFDGEVARYPAPTFDACAAEFSGDGAVYGPALHEVTGGEASIEAYEPTASVTVRLDPTVQDQGEEPLTATTSAQPCLAVLDWPLSFGRGVARR